MRLSASLGVVLVAIGSGVQAQTPIRPNMFSSMGACKTALESGYFRFYEPRYFGLRTQNPPNGEDRIVVPLETDICLEMLVVGGRRFVVQREGTLFRAQRLADGSLSIYARDDCGNPVYSLIFPPPARPAPVEVEPEYAPEPVRTPVPRIAIPRRFAPMPIAVPPPAPPDKKKGGFFRSKTFRWAAFIVGVGAGGYAAYYYWPCPPGTARQ